MFDHCNGSRFLYFSLTWVNSCPHYVNDGVHPRFLLVRLFETVPLFAMHGENWYFWFAGHWRVSPIWWCAVNQELVQWCTENEIMYPGTLGSLLSVSSLCIDSNHNFTWIHFLSTTWHSMCCQPQPFGTKLSWLIVFFSLSLVLIWLLMALAWQGLLCYLLGLYLGFTRLFLQLLHSPTIVLHFVL